MLLMRLYQTTPSIALLQVQDAVAIVTAQMFVRSAFLRCIALDLSAIQQRLSQALSPPRPAA